MKRDPIVEEIHRIREQMWDEAGGSLERLIASLRASETKNQHRVVTPDRLLAMRQRVSPPLREGFGS